MNQITRLNHAMQRASGTGRLSAHCRDGVTALCEFYQEGAAKIRIPRHHDGHGMEAVIINTAGGLTGGDVFDWSIEAGERCAVTVTTQACEKIYKSPGDCASVSILLKAGPNARIAWLPQETILFDKARLKRTLTADLARDASLLMVEATVFGRQARGESVRDVLFRDRWRIWQEGRLVHAEDLRLEGDAQAVLAASATGDGGVAVATVLLVGHDACVHLDTVRQCLDADGDVRSGASAWEIGQTGKLLARFVAKDSYALRKALIPVLELLNGAAPLPKIWSL